MFGGMEEYPNYLRTERASKCFVGHGGEAKVSTGGWNNTGFLSGEAQFFLGRSGAAKCSRRGQQKFAWMTRSPKFSDLDALITPDFIPRKCEICPFPQKFDLCICSQVGT